VRGTVDYFLPVRDLVQRVGYYDGKAIRQLRHIKEYFTMATGGSTFNLSLVQRQSVRFGLLLDFKP